MVRAKRAEASEHPWIDYCSGYLFHVPVQGGSNSPANGGGGKWTPEVRGQLRRRPL